MPEFSVIHIGAITLAAVVGVIVGWAGRRKRCVQEKFAISAGWQEQIEAQRVEHGRLVEQNKSLMQQVNQSQASGKDASNRARELSTALKEAFEKRDELQREIKEIRNNLEAAVAERKRLASDIRTRSADDESLNGELAEKDARIDKLNRELENWQNRLPPLIERFRERDDDAKRLELELAEARERIYALESLLGSEETRVEPVDAGSLPGDLEASNDTLDEPVSSRGAASGNGEGAPDPSEPERANDSPTTSLRDNLKRIKGVGPAIEKTLNELGIFRFSQLAEMSEYDIDRIARRLKGFRSRIYREDWIGQARGLHESQSGGPS